jgi:hypothetical protein
LSPLDGGAEIRRIIDGAEEVKIETPRPLMRELPPADPFPADALGDVLGAAARAIRDRVQAPLAICAQSIISAATLAVQAHADVVLPIGQARPLSGYFVSVAETGERKSACDTEATWPIRRRETALREEYDIELPSYLNAKAAFEKARKSAEGKGRGDAAKIKVALDALGPAPVPPLVPMLTCPEPTFEGLCKLFAIGHPSLGLFATEGGQFIGGHGMKDDAKLRNAAGLSDLWDGTAIRRVRSLDGASVLPGRRLAWHVMAQPAVADILFRDALLLDQGLLSRILVTAPDSAAGTRLWRDEQPETDRDLKRYGARLLDILETLLPLAPGKANELQPRNLPLSPQARVLWIAFADYVENNIAPGGELEPVRGLANKLPEHAARLAGVLRLTEEINAREIDAATMDAGIAIAEHYAAEALRLFGSARIGGHLRLAQKLLSWLLVVWGELCISLPDIYQKGPNAIRDKATAVRLVGVLEDHGWLYRIPQGAVVAGQTRRDAWRIIRG